MERRAADFRLDAPLRELCKKDIEDVCGYEKVGRRFALGGTGCIRYWACTVKPAWL